MQGQSQGSHGADFQQTGHVHVSLCLAILCRRTPCNRPISFQGLITRKIIHSSQLILNLIRPKLKTERNKQTKKESKMKRETNKKENRKESPSCHVSIYLLNIMDCESINKLHGSSLRGPDFQLFSS